jgi:hypothetical protein
MEHGGDDLLSWQLQATIQPDHAKLIMYQVLRAVLFMRAFLCFSFFSFFFRFVPFGAPFGLQSLVWWCGVVWWWLCGGGDGVMVGSAMSL